MHIHLSKIHFYLNRDLGLLYISRILIGAANSFVSLFIPIFLYKELLFPLWLVILIYGFQVALYGASLFFGYKATLLFGVKRIFALGALLNAVSIGFLLFARDNHWLIIPYLIFFILYNLFYFPAASIDEVVFTQKEARAREDSFVRSIGLSIKALIPLVSGFLIISFGFSVPFICAIILSILASIPILFSRDRHNIDDNYSIKSSIHFFKSYKNKKEFIAYIADGFKTGNLELFWPIFIFIFVPSYIALGAITTIVIIISIALTIFLGQIIDKYGSEKFLKLGTYGEAVNWGLKCLLWILSTVTSFHILFVSITHKITEITLGLTMNKEMLDHADDKGNIVEFLYVRKIARQIGSSFPFLIFAFFSYSLKDPEQIIIISFICMGIATLSFPLILIRDKSQN